MSEPSPIITPTYQNLLINQLNTIVTAINEGNQLYAFRCLRTLIISLNPKHNETLKENEVKHLSKDIAEINQLTGVDYETTWETRRNAAKTLAPKVLVLYEKVMVILHTKGYLEMQRRQRISNDEFEDLRHED